MIANRSSPRPDGHKPPLHVPPLGLFPDRRGLPASLDHDDTDIVTSDAYP